MARKILSSVLIVLSSLFLLLSMAGIAAIWIYNEPLTRTTVARLKEVDTQLAQAQAALASSEKELQRALRFVDAAQTALQKLTQQSQSAKGLFDSIQSTLDDRLLPELKTTRDRITAARTTLENLQALLEQVRGLVPGADLTLPESILNNLLESTKSLDAEIANVEQLTTQVSTFVSDTSYLLGGDLTQTRASLQNFLASIQDYENRVGSWREQDQRLIQGAPRWIDEASAALTVFLLWFALSQFGLLLHGLNLRAGGNPLEPLKRRPKNPPIPTQG